MGLEMEEMAKKLKMGLDAQKSFAQMHEDRNMNKGIRGKMMQLDFVIVQKSREEIRIAKTQSPFKIWSKSNNFARILVWTMSVFSRQACSGIPLVVGL